MRVELVEVKQNLKIDIQSMEGKRNKMHIKRKVGVLVIRCFFDFNYPK